MPSSATHLGFQETEQHITASKKLKNKTKKNPQQNLPSTIESPIQFLPLSDLYFLTFSHLCSGQALCYYDGLDHYLLQIACFALAVVSTGLGRDVCVCLWMGGGWLGAGGRGGGSTAQVSLVAVEFHCHWTRIPTWMPPGGNSKDHKEMCLVLWASWWICCTWTVWKGEGDAGWVPPPGGGDWGGGLCMKTDHTVSGPALQVMYRRKHL